MLTPTDYPADSSVAEENLTPMSSMEPAQNRTSRRNGGGRRLPRLIISARSKPKLPHHPGGRGRVRPPGDFTPSGRTRGHAASRRGVLPAPIPFPLLHVDTTYKFREMITFRDRYARQVGARLIVHTNQEAIADGTQPFAVGTQRCCGLLKTKSLLDALEAGGFDAAFGGARRDEERSRAKERIFSLRDPKGQWDPKRQRPELWHLLNSRIRPGESIRTCSNWTELDVWHYIQVEQIPVVPLYFAQGAMSWSAATRSAARAEFVPLLPASTERVMCRCDRSAAACTVRCGRPPTRFQDHPGAHLGQAVRRRVIDHDQDARWMKKREGYLMPDSCIWTAGSVDDGSTLMAGCCTTRRRSTKIR
jgi:sulfate adenylyltransferase subunit 2